MSATVFDFERGGRAPVAPSSAPLIAWSPVDRSASKIEVVGEGDFTTGARFQPIVAVSCTGVRFRRSSADAGTIKASLWNGAGTLLATVNKAVTGVNTYEAVFTSPVVLTPHQRYVVGVYDTAGAAGRFNLATEADSGYPSVNFISGALLWEHFALYWAGDGRPNIASPDGAVAIYGVEPIFTVVT